MIYKKNTRTKTKDRAMRTPLNYKGVLSSCMIGGSRRVTCQRHEHHLTRESLLNNIIRI